MAWLCDGWRSRYNQLRSRRHKYDKTTQQLTPIGNSVNTDTDRQARQHCSWLTAIPAMILQSPNRIENTDWWAANKRRKTLKKQGKNPGSMPRFKTRKQDQYFVCWYNNGANARYRKLNKHHGEVIITGQNPKTYTLQGQPSRYSIHIRVRVSQPIRPYTSIGVNWSKHTLIFVNEPQATQHTRTGAITGIDRGVTHAITLSNGQFHDLPKQQLQHIDQQIRHHQKQQAHRVQLSGKTVREYQQHPSRNYTRTSQTISKLYAKAHRIINDWQHKTTTSLTRAYDVIILENLQLANMSRKAKPRQDQNGRYLPNGQTAKRGLNRALRSAALATLATQLEYKTKLAHSTLISVNPAYTSQTCSNCQYCARENRESQAVFSCKQCGQRMNADVNAAINILNRGIQEAFGLGEAEHVNTDHRTLLPSIVVGVQAAARVQPQH